MKNNELSKMLDEAIGLYLEFKDVHGYEPKRARDAAVLEVLEGINALADIAAYEAEEREISNSYTDEMAQSLAEVRTAVEHRLADYSLVSETGIHLYHCALVYHLRDGLTPDRAARLAWHENILVDCHA